MLSYPMALSELRMLAVSVLGNFRKQGLGRVFKVFFLLKFSLGSGRGSLNPNRDSKFRRKKTFKKFFRNELDGASRVISIFWKNVEKSAEAFCILFSNFCENFVQEGEGGQIIHFRNLPLLCTFRDYVAPFPVKSGQSMLRLSYWRNIYLRKIWPSGFSST